MVIDRTYKEVAVMAASEEAMGAGHPATFTEQPAPKTRHAEMSGIAYHEDTDDDTVIKGFTGEIPLPQHDFSHEA